MTEQLSLTTDGVEMIDYSDNLKDNVMHAALAWSAFVNLPQDIKNNYTANSLQSGVGYEKKGSGERESRDIKENFDITTAGLIDLGTHATNNSTAQQFIHSAKDLFTGLEDMIIQFGEHVERTYDINGFALESQAGAANAFVRFLYYPPTPAGTLIGEPHVDHSGFTFHLYESTDGCERLSFDKRTWHPLPVAPGKAAAFCSMQSQLQSHGLLKGLCHKVTSNDTTAATGRTAIVCFVPLVNLPSYDRPTHGRLQDKQAGFNYDMEAKAFAELFKQN